MLKIVSVLGVCIFSELALAAPLKLHDYLSQVKSANDGIKASQLSGEASVDKATDSSSIYQPVAFALVQKAQDKKELVPVGQRGTQSDLMIYQGGVSKLTEWGTAGKIYYTSSNTSLKGTASQFVPEPSWYEAGLTVEVSQPLLKNSLGSDLRRSVELQRKQSEIVGLSEGLKRKLTLTEAEGIYWRLAIARESVRYARENIGRSNRIVEWNRSRVNRELADAAELIQSEALQQVRDIELTMALDEERAASHAFNTVRGSSETAVQEELTTISKEILSAIPTPSRQGEREDVRVAATLEAISDLGLSLADSKYDPSLDI